MTRYKTGIDMGGTKTEIIVLSPEDTEVFRKRIETPADKGYQAVLESIAGLFESSLQHVGEGTPDFIGIGIPGPYDKTNQRIIYDNQGILAGKNFKKDLENRLKVEIRMENDANCFTLAETLKGAAQGIGRVYGIIMGTGCGGGLCVNGEIWHGRHGIAGEWGHVSVDPEGETCYCGNRGCIETKISGTGVKTRFYKKTGRSLEMPEIVSGFRNGDPECVEAFETFLDDFGRCVGGLISILDPDAIVIGGGLSEIGELYEAGVKRVQDYAYHPKVHTPILKNRLGDSAGVYGAAWL